MLVFVEARGRVSGFLPHRSVEAEGVEERQAVVRVRGSVVRAEVLVLRTTEHNPIAQQAHPTAQGGPDTAEEKKSKKGRGGEREG